MNLIIKFELFRIISYFLFKKLKINKYNLICAKPTKILWYLTAILHPNDILDRPLHSIATTGHALKANGRRSKKKKIKPDKACVCFFSSPSEMVFFGVGTLTHSLIHSL